MLTSGNSFRIFSAEAKDTPQDYLQKELGIKLRSLQDNNSMLAIKEPSIFLKKRDNVIKGMFDATIKKLDDVGVATTDDHDGRVTKHYVARKAELDALGIPSDKAHQLATESAQRLYEEELRILEYSMPSGYQQAFSTVAVDHNATVAKNEIARDEFDKKAYKMKLKNKYKKKYNK